jgi:pyruvate,orthophosphate dikinase
MISEQEAVHARRSDRRWTSCCIRRLIPKAERDVSSARGLPASPGAASGKRLVFTAESRRDARGRQGESVILVRIETSARGYKRHARGASGILTTRGGMTSHAAVVARGMGRPCVSGAGELLTD